MKGKKTIWIVIGGIGLVAAGAGIYFLLKNKNKSDAYGNQKLKATGKDKAITGGLGGGVQTTTSGSSLPMSEPDWENPFSISYAEDVKKWVAPKRLILLKDAAAKQYAEELKKAKGILDDDEEAIGNVFAKKVKDKIHVSNVARAFWQRYNKDLLAFLKSTLSESEMEKHVLNYVRQLPNYRTA
jgi:hypothetical protein